jgi:hypothetical protein
MQKERPSPSRKQDLSALPHRNIVDQLFHTWWMGKFQRITNSTKDQMAAPITPEIRKLMANDAGIVSSGWSYGAFIIFPLHRRAFPLLQLRNNSFR